MILLIYLIIVFFLFNFLRPLSAGLLLIFIYTISLACGLIIGRDYEVNSLSEIFNLFFMIIVLNFFIKFQPLGPNNGSGKILHHF